MNSADFNLVCNYLRHWANTTPNSEATVYNSERLSWATLYAQVESMACQLMAQGIKKGDRVAMLAPARNEYLITYLATIIIGGIWYGIHPRYSQREIEYLLKEAGAKVLVTVDHYFELNFQNNIEEIYGRLDSLKSVIVIGKNSWEQSKKWHLQTPSAEQLEKLQSRAASIEPSDGALIVFTSGTTGQPKGALLTHHNILSNIHIQNRHFSFEQSSVSLIHFPINHVACSTELSIGSLLVGSKMVFMDKFDPVDTLEMVSREKITILGQIPTMFLLEFALPNYDEYDLSSVKTYIWSGSSAPLSMIQKLQKTSARLITGYGMTEAGGFIAYSRPNASEDELSLGAGIIDPAFELRLVDEKRIPLTEQQRLDGVIGEICLRGNCIMKQYWGREQQTKETIDTEGWYYTGDMARLDINNNIYLVGRNKDMFISGGFNIYPREIEAVIEKFPCIAMVSVIPMTDPVFQEVGKALLVLKAGQSLDEDELKNFCRQQLANFKVPKYFETIDNFPFLANGKIDKKALLNQFSD